MATNAQFGWKVPSTLVEKKSVATQCNSLCLPNIHEDVKALTLNSVEKNSVATQCNSLHAVTYTKAAQTEKMKWNKFIHENGEIECTQDVGTQTDEVTPHAEVIKEAKDFFMNENNLIELLVRLNENGQIPDFLLLLKSLKNGLLPMDNISWLCLLDRAKYASCKSTTVMKYRPETTEFWSTVYLLFGNSALSVFRGSTHFGKVVTEQCRKGQYNPQDGTCNFSVPSVPTLRKVKTGFSRTFDPGFIEPTLHMAAERSAQGRQFTLALDGKKIGKMCLNVEIVTKQMLRNDCLAYLFPYI